MLLKVCFLIDTDVVNVRCVVVNVYICRRNVGLEWIVRNMQLVQTKAELPNYS